MTSVNEIAAHVDGSVAGTDDVLVSAQAAVDGVGGVVGCLSAAGVEAGEVAGAFAALNADGMADRTALIVSRAEELTRQAEAIRLGFDAAVRQLGVLKKAEVELRVEVEALKGLLPAATGTSPETGTGTGTRGLRRWSPAGVWVPVPGGARHFGRSFNEEYEKWVRASTGGPDDKEYMVEKDGKKVHFDATTVETRDKQPVEVLIDAKGRYAQFVNKKTNEFHEFFAKPSNPKQGLPGMLLDAKRQVTAADGVPVEWWCAEEAAADAFQEHFERDKKLNGFIEAVYKPMPDKN